MSAIDDSRDEGDHFAEIAYVMVNGTFDAVCQGQELRVTYTETWGEGVVREAVRTCTHPRPRPDIRELCRVSRFAHVCGRCAGKQAPVLAATPLLSLAPPNPLPLAPCLPIRGVAATCPNVTATAAADDDSATCLSAPTTSDLTPAAPDDDDDDDDSCTPSTPAILNHRRRTATYEPSI